MDIELLVEGEGLVEVETIRVPEGSAAREIVIAVAAKGHFAAEEAFLFVEDSDEPIDPVLVLDKSMAGRVHHVHRAHRIDVRVFYQGRHIDRRFGPSTRVERVLDWAVGDRGFAIDPIIAPEMELALHGQTTALPKNAHIGRYVQHPHCELAFDLIRGIVPNGASR